jgi:Phage late-transcription coactivator
MLNVTQANIVEEIDKLCRTRGMEYIDAAIHWCELNRVEVEYVAGIIKKDPVMRSKIQAEAENLNILKRGAVLPL